MPPIYQITQHHKLVVGFCNELSISNMINQALNAPESWKVNFGYFTPDDHK